MNRLVIFLIFLCSCSTMKSNSPIEQDFVTVQTALDQAQMSYLRGCVEGSKELTQKGQFPYCKEKAKLHREEIQSILDQKISEE